MVNDSYFGRTVQSLQAKHSVDAKDFKKKFDEQEETNAVGLMNHGAMTELRRDRIDDASVHYLNEQRGMSTILLNSLAGGLGYREAQVEKEAKDKN